MLYKERVFNTLERDIVLLNTCVLSLDKHAITAEVMKRNLEQIKEDLEQISLLVGRESERKYTNVQLQ